MAEALSVRESLQAAMAEDTPEPIVAPVEAVTPEPAPLAAEPAPIDAPKPDDATLGAQRDDKGRFAPKEPTAAVSAEPPPPAAVTPTIETAPPEDKGASQEPTRVPPSLPAAVKAQWTELKPEVQAAFHKLEETVQTAKAEWGKKGERLNRYDEIMAPRSERLTLQGIDEFTAIKTLFAAQDFLERDPMGGLQYLARSYGVDLRSLASQPTGQVPGAEGQQAPTAAPDISAALRPLAEQVQALQQQLQTQTQSAETTALATATATITEFASKPEHMYFANVQEDVAQRLESGRAKTLEQAYQQAIWADDEIRPLLLKQQALDAAKANGEAAQRSKSHAATQAAGSVTGAPAPGAVASQKGSTGNLRADLQAAWVENQPAV